jgi:hypothetical protein
MNLIQDFLNIFRNRPGMNGAGGFLVTDELDRDRAEFASLITLPTDINGKNCGNCQYIKNKVCVNKHLDGIQVNDRMGCRFWEANVPGTIEAWKTAEPNREISR